MGRPIGSQNKDKAFKEALLRALARAEKKGGNGYERVARSLIRQAVKGSVAAIKEIADRVDGKCPTVIAGSDEHPAVRTERVITWRKEDMLPYARNLLESTSTTSQESNSPPSTSAPNGGLASWRTDDQAKQ